MAKICAFFGHRNIPAHLRPLLQAQIIHAIESEGVTEFWNGCYGDFDNLAAEVVISLKARYPQIVLRQVYAYPPQYPSLRRGFDSAFYPDILRTYPDHWHIPRRNLWMARQCDMAICYVEHAGSRIHEPLDWMQGRKRIVNLGVYLPSDLSAT